MCLKYYLFCRKYYLKVEFPFVLTKNIVDKLIKKEDDFGA